MSHTALTDCAILAPYDTSVAYVSRKSHDIIYGHNLNAAQNDVTLR